MADAAKSLKVFVSYSRTDVEFADQLVLALEDKGFLAILDRHDMSGGENWRERLGKLILSADAVTFILSEKSAASEICAWEVEEARRLSKRIVPVTPASVANVKPPQQLSDLNWIPFYADPAIPGSGFYYGVKRLEDALRLDLDWLRAQTRYSERAVEWTKAARAEDLLLRGEALREAHAWLSKTPAGSSPPDSVREYLSASADAEQKREAAARLQIEEREQAVKAAEAAVNEKQQAVAAKARADRMLRALAMSALVVGMVLVATAGVGLWYAARNFVELAARDAKLFAREANILSARGDKVMAMMVALSGDPAARRGPLERWFNPNGYPLAREALARALATNRLVGSVQTGEPITAMAAFADDSHFLTFHKGGVVHMWQADKSVPLQTIKLKEDVKRAVLFKDGLRALVLTATGQPVLVRLSDGAEQGAFGGQIDREITSMAVGSDEKQVLTGGYDGAIELWSIATGERIARWEALEPPESAFRFAEVVGLDFTKDGTGFVSADGNGTIARWQLNATKPVVRAQLGDYLSASSLTLPADADMAIVGASNGRMYGYSLNDLKVSGDYQVFDLALDNAVTGVLFSQKSQNMVVTSQSGRVSILRNNGVSSNEFGSVADITAAIHLKGGQTAITGSRDGAVRQWSLAKTSTQLLQLGGQGLDGDAQGPLPQSITLSADGRQALLRYYNGETNKLWRRDATPGATDFNGLLMSPDGQFAIRLKQTADPGGIGLDREREIVRLADDKVVHTIARDVSPVGFVRNDAVLLEDTNGQLSIWKFGSTSALWASEQPGDRGYGGVFATSPDGSRVLAIYDRKVMLWEVASSKPKAMLNVDQDVTEARFLPDSKRFVLGFRTGELEMWSVESSAPLESFDGHAGEVRQIAFNKTGSLMASAAIDGTASLWRIGQPEQLQTFDTRGAVYSIAFDPAGEKVVIASPDGISEWQIEPVALADADKQVELACKELEKLNIVGFSTREVLSIPTLKGLPNNPCVAMGITQPRPSPAMAKPPATGASAGTGSAP